MHHLFRWCSCACTSIDYDHINLCLNLNLNILKLLIWINNINFSLRATLETRKSLSTRQDSNLHPSQSGWVPLPLDHLHSCFSLVFSSQLRAYWSDPWPWPLCMHTAMWLSLGGKCTCASSFQMMLMCMHLDWLWSYKSMSKSKSKHSQIAYMN